MQARLKPGMQYNSDAQYLFSSCAIAILTICPRDFQDAQCSMALRLPPVRYSAAYAAEPAPHP